MRERFNRWFRAEEHARQAIDEELASHLAARIDYLVGRGMSPDDARVEALRRFGDLEAGRAALLAQARSRRRRLELRDRVDGLRQDVRYVGRALVRHPAYSLGVVATLALGFGINAAVFRVADQVLLRPPAGVEDPHNVRRVEALVTFAGGAPQRATTFSYNDAKRLVDSGAFGAAAIHTPPRVVSDADGREVVLSFADDAFFPLLTASLRTGRSFDAGEGAPGSSPGVAVVSTAYWRRALSGQPLGAGLDVALNGRSYRVIGVAGDGFRGIDLDPVDVWLSLGDARLGEGRINGVVIPWYQADMLRPLLVVGRVSRSPETIVADQLTASLGGADLHLGRQRKATLHPVVPVGDQTRLESARALLRRLAAVALLVLVIAAANAVNLLLARGLRRGREIAIRLAIGASRSRVARLLLVESVVLACLGGAAAILFGMWTADALRRLLLPDARWTAGVFDERTVLFTAALALITGVAAGLWPALQATGDAAGHALKDARTPGGRAGWTRAALIVVQTALSLALLVGCGLLVRSLVRLNGVDLGFDPAGLMVVSPGRSTLDEQGIAAIADRLARRPGVPEVALASIAPFGATGRIDITVPGSTFEPASPFDVPLFSAVDAKYFDTMRTPIVRGRGFHSDDVAGSEMVAVVNESMARTYWDGGEPFDSCILASPNACARVVGVVRDVRESGAAAAPMRFHLSLAQTSRPATALLVRAEPQALGSLAADVAAMVPGSAPATIDIVADRIARSLRPWRVATLLFAVLGVIAVVLAGIGIYSVSSYLVAERHHEMGVRLALGATGSDVVRLVLRRGGQMVVVGGALGLLGAAAGGRMLGALLFDVSPVDPLIYVAAACVLLLLGLTAMLPAAVRAARTDPVEALRVE